MGFRSHYSISRTESGLSLDILKLYERKIEYRDDAIYPALKMLGQLARDPNVPFTWRDAQQCSELIAKNKGTDNPATQKDREG
jgi:hypothetical protein